MTESQTARLQDLIDKLKVGDAKAKDDLVKSACDRLLRLTRKMLKSYPGVARWEQTDDIFQNAAIRLYRSLNDSPPQSVQHFFNLAAMHIRRELIDLARHHFGPQGAGSHHDTGNDQRNGPLADASNTTLNPSKLAQWSEFHEHVNSLPAEEREIFDLLWYHGVSQSDAAKLLNLSERTLQRRWQSARLKVFEAMKGVLPD